MASYAAMQTAESKSLPQNAYVPLAEGQSYEPMVPTSAEPPAEAGEATTELVVRRAGVAHAVVSWWEADLGGGATVSTAPGAGGLMRGHSWGQLAVFLAPGGVRIDAGATLVLRTYYTDQGLAFDLE